MFKRKFNRRLFSKEVSKRVISLFLLTFFVINTFPVKTHAVNIYSEGELKQIVYSNVDKIKNKVVSYNTQRGVFINFRVLITTALWVQFIHENGANISDSTKKVVFSDTDKTYYYSLLTSKVKDINNFDNSKNEAGVVEVKLPEPPQTYNKTYMATLFSYIATYMDNWYNTTLQNYNSKGSEDEKTKFLNDNKLTITSAYEVLISLSQEYDFMRGVSITQNSLVDFSTEIAPITNIVKKTEYQPLFDCAIKQLEIGINFSTGITVSDPLGGEKSRRNQIIQMLTEVDSGGNFTDRINRAYLAILASSSVYVPFKSKLGDDSFEQALSYIATGEDKEEIMEIYNDIGTIKKPLYFTQFYSGAKYTPTEKDCKDVTSLAYSNSAEQLSLGRFVELIRDQAEGALITVKGAFQPSLEDSDTYSGFIGIKNEINSGESPTGEDSENNSNESSDDKEDEEDNNEQASIRINVPVLMSGMGLGNMMLNSYTINLPYAAWYNPFSWNWSWANPLNWFNSNKNNSSSSSNSSSNNSSGQTTVDNSNIPSTTPGDSSSSNNSSSNNSSSDSSSSDSSSSDSSSSGNNTNGVDSSDNSELVAYGEEQPLNPVITDRSKLTDPIMIFKRDGMTGINYVLLRNIFAEGSEGETGINLKDNSMFSKMLYVTPFGDIVTGDNTVIVPGSSNATFYNYNEKVLYYPFTDGFMSTYPTIASKEEFEVSSKDIGKTFIYLSKWDEFFDWANIFSSATTDNPSELSIGYIKDVDKVGKEFWTNGTNVNTIDYCIYDPNTGDSYNIFQPKQKDFKMFSTGMVNGSSYLYTINTNVLTSGDLAVPLYPYTNAQGEDSKARAEFIVRSFYYSMMIQGDGSIGETPNERLDLKYIRNMLIDVIDGRKSVIGFERSVQNQQSILNGDDGGIFGKINSGLKSIANSFVTLFGDAPGMLGLRSASQDGFMGKVLYYSYKAFPFISIFVVIILIALYMRQKMGLVSSVFYAACGLIGVYLLIYLAPKYLADITNFIPNNGSNALAFDSLVLRQEVFRENGSIKPVYSDFGKFSYAESSITLYNFKDEQLEEVCEAYGQELDQILSGDSFVIDDASGLFVQGYKLKMSLDKLFDGVSITGSVDTFSNFAVYKLEKKNYVDSVINYYTPFNLMADGLIKKLNNLSRVYLLTRSQLPYPNNQVKDAFFMNSYVKSPIFISPREPWKMDEDMSETTKALITDYFMTTELGNEDFIGFYETLNDYIDDNRAQDTLWYQTMEQNGYFDEETGPVLLSNLVAYVNNNTREFLVKNIDKLPYVSDETWVEVTSLYATMLFNTQVSQFYNKLYPERINYEELSVVDTLRPIITKDYNRFSQSSRDIVDYVFAEYGFLGTLTLAVIVALQGVTSLILTYAIFIMYFLLIAFVIVKLFIRPETMKSTITGFLKLYGTLVGVYFVNTWGLQILNNFDSSGLTLFFIMILSVVVSGFSTSVVFYTITGFSTLDFANERSMQGMFNFADKLTFGLLKGMTKNVKSMTDTLLARNVRVGSKTGMDKKINIIQNEYSAYDDGRMIDSYVKDYYSDRDYDSTEDFYNRRVNYRRSNRINPRVNLDIEDDGDFLN